uniref:Leishmanolysin-like peptidase n=1 Tax=Trypanosoma congolense (strain IL3000) TaxID=1068625 RepID=F9WE34_TRYCI|nr:Major Surface Protease [Trypanosoma congolense IL3000]
MTPMRSSLALLLLTLLHRVLGSSVPPSPRCISDEVAARAGPPVRLATRNIAHSQTGADSEWSNIRIVTFTKDIEDERKHCTAEGQKRPTFFGDTADCTSDDVLTAAKKDLVITRLIPSAVQLHVDRLLVKPEAEPLVLPKFDGKVCSSFTVPASHNAEGVPDADMAMYAAAGPMPAGVAAWATTCIVFDDDRPAAGVMNLGVASISLTETSIRTVAHEIAHSLGFSFYFMSNAKTVTRVPGVRGKKEVVLVSSPRTLQKTREHYKCPAAAGMELEDEGGSGTAMSHWERRNAKDEFMSGISGPGRYTALTMAAFEDLGYYRSVWGMEEPMGWGNSSGCELLTEKCLVEGVTAYPAMFCNGSEVGLTCTSDGSALGECFTVQYESELPAEYQYFSDTKLGGSAHTLMDYCPYIFGYSNTRCSDGDIRRMYGSVIGPSSKCLKGNKLLDNESRPVGDVCADVRCDNGTVSVRYLGNSEWQLCPAGGAVTPTETFTGGTILCPKYEEVCIVAAVVTKLNTTNSFASVAQPLLLALLVAAVSSS